MNEATVRQEIGRMLREYGYWPIHFQDASVCPRCHFEIKPAIGRPDIIAPHPSFRAVVCEVKVFNGSFSFSAITEEQRRWLSAWTEVSGLAYLGLGTTEGRAGTDGGRRCWLVPWNTWLMIEDALCAYQESIPLLAGRGYKTELQELHLDCTHLLANWELTWKGGWHPQNGYQFTFQKETL